ncbi:GGDEF domain-containing protein [Geodermatophilus obscurus]|nr:GGDEF domain-containing protein [Geodermatophilus obscurus]
MTDRFARPPRAGVVVAAVVVAAFLLATSRLPPTSSAITSDVVQLLVAGAAAATTATRARRCPPGRVRTAWLLLALSCASWCAGQGYWSWLSARGEAPFPSLADAGFLGFAVLAVAGLVVHPAGGGRTGSWQRVLDSVMTCGAVSLLSWETVLGAVVAVDNGYDDIARTLLLAYPVADVVMVVLAVLLLAHTRGDRTALNLVGLGVLAQAIADSTFAYLTATSNYDGGSVDVGWVVAFLLIALAGTCPVDSPRPADRRPGAGPPSVPVSVVPYIPVVAAFGVALGATFSGHPLTSGELLVVTVVVGTLLARQYATVRENTRLAADLAAREVELEHLAFHDPLTGLANRALFRDRLEHALELHTRDPRGVALVFLDLDDFKAVNDTFGHGVGDELLTRVSERITGALRGGDTIARLGGDEFAVLLEDGGDGLTSATRIADALRAPFVLAGRTLQVGASIGVCALEPTDPSVGADALLARSDAAMYQAKHNGKARVVSYDVEAPASPAAPVG